MMKNKIARIAALFLVLACLFVCIPCAGISAEPLDISTPCSLTVCYKRQEKLFEGVAVKTYKIADMKADGSFALTDEFEKYPVSIYTVESQAEWKKITSTLASYIDADAIPPHHTAVTDAEGKVCFEGISAGLYLTCAVKVEQEGVVTLFENFITALPGQGTSSFEYDITAYPKSDEYTQVPEKVYKVVKQWKDRGHEDERPSEVTVEIYRDGALFATQALSEENDWCFTWTAPVDESIWKAVERNISDGYTVTVTEDGGSFVITNTHSEFEEPPFTGDTNSVIPYVIMLCVSGMLVVAMSVLMIRREK